MVSACRIVSSYFYWPSMSPVDGHNIPHNPFLNSCVGVNTVSAFLVMLIFIPVLSGLRLKKDDGFFMVLYRFILTRHTYNFYFLMVP